MDIAKHLISLLDIEKITDVSFTSTKYGDGTKRLSIEIDYLDEEVVK
ncbi:hypothetical protein [Lactococcus garvieae]|nr:hypothetical protein [Lactococcus garvieae]